jgi:hypothetical protein
MEIINRDYIRKDAPMLKSSIHSQLSHASGALSDIQIIVTSCVPKDANGKLKEIASAVLQRILCSANKVHSKPSWYIHDWEKELWKKYLNGDFKACATDIPCIQEADRLEKGNPQFDKCPTSKKDADTGLLVKIRDMYGEEKTTELLKEILERGEGQCKTYKRGMTIMHEDEGDGG